MTDTAELIRVREQIEGISQKILKGADYIMPAGKNKALAIAEYDQQIAVNIVKLKLGEGLTIDGVLVKDPPVGIMREIAKGAAFDACCKKETADAAYKSAIEKLDALKAALNALQSVYRHME
ncbi:MAG: hypothetical protein GY832_11775 [Chloroflexi bacterium]|nr:hypothetical protein [Chloroflexota bacterium]